jgi:acyl-CoA dehydrogenase
MMPDDDVAAVARRVVSGAVAPHAEAVDRYSRFPEEAIAALRASGLLSAGIPRDVGGLGCSVLDLAQLCMIIAEGCASTGLIFAMHQLQLLCIVRHAADAEDFRSFLAEAAARQLLLGSGTSERGTGGDIRSSIAHVDHRDGMFCLRKECSILSYGAQADAILVTARRHADAAAADQVLVLLAKPDYALEQVGSWDALGMRGTCSPPATVIATAKSTQIFPEPFRRIASRTMVPLAHLLWAACWLGIARSAVSIATRRIRSSARQLADVQQPANELLAATSGELFVLEAMVNDFAAEQNRAFCRSEPVAASSVIAFRANAFKINASSIATKICLACLEICGFPGYLEDAASSVSRQVRDVLSSLVMLNNRRLAAINAGLLHVVPPI